MSNTERLEGGGAGKSGLCHHPLRKNILWFQEFHVIGRRKIKTGGARTGLSAVFSQLSPKRKPPSSPAPAPLWGSSPTTSVALCLHRVPFLDSQREEISLRRTPKLRGRGEGEHFGDITNAFKNKPYMVYGRWLFRLI